MNTAELMQAVHDAGCEFDCKVYGDLYEYLREIDEVWVMLPAAFAWVQQSDSPNNSRLFASFYHVHNKTGLNASYDSWRIGSIYSKLNTVYDYPTGEAGHERIPVAIELNEGDNPFKERDRLTHPGAITMILRDLVDEAREITKEIKATNVRAAAKEYEA